MLKLHINTYVYIYIFTHPHRIVVNAPAHNMDCVGHRLVYLHYHDSNFESDQFHLK